MISRQDEIRQFGANNGTSVRRTSPCLSGSQSFEASEALPEEGFHLMNLARALLHEKGEFAAICWNSLSK
ncbi:hypothetical protein [Alteribacillus sp. HJP-4]|uniref:hypothetical protein n=1 Tax=Alteribacillus sp. HJP-4 TaxID=2775394 RepID=UPI0035CD1B7E